MQLELTLYPDEQIAGPEIAHVEELFEPDGHRRCEACRKRVHAFGGPLMCANPYCPGMTR